MGELFTDRILQEFVHAAPELKDHIESVALSLLPTFEPPFERLIRSIVYQQLSGKAASTIFNRFMELIERLTPENILNQSDEDLKAVGLSRQKLGYVKNVAEAFQHGGVLNHYSTSEDLEGYSGEKIIDEFTQIKGVGKWTVQMYLIFGLGYLDIFPATDLGVRKGLQRLYKLDEMPTPGKAKKLVDHWKYPTIGAILCWRILDTQL